MKPLPDLLLDRRQAQVGGVEAVEPLPARDRRQPPVEGVAPGVVGADEAVAAVAAGAVGDPRGAVAADVVEAAHHAVGAAQGEDALVQEVEGLVVAGVGHVVDVADDLPGLPKQRPLLQLEEARVGVEPRRQALLRRRRRPLREGLLGAHAGALRHLAPT